jgi:hypothetical protein
MISNADIAKRVSELMLDFSTRIDNSIAEVQDNCDSDEFKAYRKTAGRVLGEIYTDILTPLYLKHPALKPPGMK